MTLGNIKLYLDIVNTFEYWYKAVVRQTLIPEGKRLTRQIALLQSRDSLGSELNHRHIQQYADVQPQSHCIGSEIVVTVQA